MTPNDNISAELMELSPLLAGIPAVNVFKVPDSYFESLPLQLLLAKSGDFQTGPEKSFSVPEGYFENLSSSILGKIKGASLANEMDEFSAVVAGISNKNIFTVPAGYFEALPATLLNIAKKDNTEAEMGAEISAFKKENVYQAPAGYFDGLSSNILARIKAESLSKVATETAEISATVAGIGKENVYAVPVDYFIGFADNLPRTTTTTQAKVVSMKGRFGAFKYAVAAAVTAVIGVSLFFTLNRNEQTDNSAKATMVAAKEIIKTNSFESELNSISDAAIVNFLEAKGENVEAALVASLVDDKNLPEASDYLFDDNALNEILKTVDLSN